MGAGDAENDGNENLLFLDHTAVPVSVYDPVRKVFVRKPGHVRTVAPKSPRFAYS